MLYLLSVVIVLIITLLSNPNLRIINKKITHLENIIKYQNLTNNELSNANDNLRFLNLNRYRIIIQEPLD
jgi:hypothetical protein